MKVDGIQQIGCPYRHVARITIEAETPIAIGCGALSFLTDSPVARDFNGLPYIPGTALAGVVRHALEDNSGVQKSYGYHDKEGGMGSRFVYTAHPI